MKNKTIKHVDVEKYRPLPFQGIFDEREDDLEYRTLNIIFNELSEPDRNLLLASIEFGSQSALAKELNVSCATISLTLKRIKEYIKNKIENDCR